MSADALKRAGSPQAPNAHQRAADHARALQNTVRDPRMKRLFDQRPMNAALFETTPVPSPAAASPVRPSTPPGAASPGAPERA
jgi:hypothetical protein